MTRRNKSKHTTLDDFENNIENIGNVILNCFYIFNVIETLNKSSDNLSKNLIGLPLLEFLIGKIWVYRCDTDKTTLSFINFYKLSKLKFKYDIKFLSKIRNNILHHANNNSFNFIKNLNEVRNSKRNNNLLYDILIELKEQYFDICIYFNKINNKDNFLNVLNNINNGIIPFKINLC